ncbi:uncharacterized protein LOC112184508 isoform X3 [Rosa chinensis]|uniref:uncharacterized protein LOC112184508 isoform X3 n=1 Tax=Rosa chinensis TaxID=74649 RepID=UPI001AD92C75|nr:uncharacterized protein LOC112184508 isoform X3 [Rosa chinensis]
MVSFVSGRWKPSPNLRFLIQSKRNPKEEKLCSSAALLVLPNPKMTRLLETETSPVAGSMWTWPSDCVAYLDCTWNLIQLVGHSTFNDEQRRLSFYAAMFLPLRKTMYKDRKAKDVPVVNYFFRDSLKQRDSNAETVINLHNALEKFVSLLPHFVPNGDVKLAEVDLGREYVDVPLTSEESKLRVLTGFLLREIKDFCVILFSFILGR